MGIADTTITLRPVEPRDRDAVVAMHNQAMAADGVPYTMSADEFDYWLDDIDPAADSRLAEVDGATVGWILVHHTPSGVDLERSFIDGVVAADHRGRGVGRALVAWAKERAADQLRATGNELPKYIRAANYDFVESATALFARFGFEPVRYSDELIRPLFPPLPLDSPPGITIAPWPQDRDRDGNEEIRAVKNAAFADHWGSIPSPADAWARWLDESTTRLDLSWVALDDDRVVGHCLNARYPHDDAITGRRDAWIQNLGTLPRYRGRGIASALIAHSLAAFVDDGLTHAMLGVDSASPTGADRLYRKLGFEPYQRSITQQIEL